MYITLSPKKVAQTAKEKADMESLKSFKLPESAQMSKSESLAWAERMKDRYPAAAFRVRLHHILLEA